MMRLPLPVSLGFGMLLTASVLTMSARADDVPDTRPEIPDPLTLDAALGLIDTTHPDLIAAEAGRARAESGRLDAEADDAFDARLRGRLRWVEPNDRAALQQHDDHSVTLAVRKRITDFGVTDARLAAAEADTTGADLGFVNAQRQHRIAVIRAFFDVIEADLRAAWHSEAMQVEYLRQEDIVEANALRETSDLDVARADAVYQLALARSYTTEATQRTARQALAQVLNRPRQLPSVVLRPGLPLLDRPVPDEAFSLVDEALAHNAGLRALEARIAAAQQRMEAARGSDGPVLDFEGEVGGYSRDLGGNDDLRIGVVLEVPLTTGGRSQARIAAARAALLDAQAERGQLEMSLRRQVLERWQDLGLARYRRAEAQANMHLRDMELERSRMQFEQQVQSNLGNAMANYTEAEYRAAVADHELAMTWLQLDALLGREITLSAETPPVRGE